MNVLMFGWEFPPNISGGLGTACYGIIKGLLSHEDVQVTFVVPKAHGNEHSIGNLKLVGAEQLVSPIIAAQNKLQDQFRYIEISSELAPYDTPEIFHKRQLSRPLNENQAENPKIYFSGKYGPSLFDEIKNYSLVAKSIAKQYAFDVIHAHDWLTFPAATVARQVSGKPLIVHIHSTDFDRSGGSPNPTIYEIEKQGMDEADHIITVSNLIKRRLIEQYQIPEQKITTIYNAVETNDKNRSPIPKIRNDKRKVVTFLGRLTIQKGPEYFIHVARLIISKMKHVHFVMAGSGEMRNRLIELCANYRIGDHFHFTGFLNGKEVEKMLSQSDAVIMPSVSEPFGIVPLEAMKSKVPVIISRQSGVSELIQRAIKTDFWDVHAMADALHCILKHKQLSKTLRKEGINEVSKLNWETTATQIRNVYALFINKIAS